MSRTFSLLRTCPATPSTLVYHSSCSSSSSLDKKMSLRRMSARLLCLLLAVKMMRKATSAIPSSHGPHLALQKTCRQRARLSSWVIRSLSRTRLRYIHQSTGLPRSGYIHTSPLRQHASTIFARSSTNTPAHTHWRKVMPLTTTSRTISRSPRHGSTLSRLRCAS
jgi:hypothetical protein